MIMPEVLQASGTFKKTIQNCFMRLSTIQQRIYDVRGQRVMLDFSLAELYGVTTKMLNQAVRRNIERFPKEFMFQLTPNEVMKLKSDEASVNWSQIVTSSQKHRTALPYAFTEHGVAMLASVLRSKKAIKMNIAIIKAFIALRQIIIETKELTQQIKEIKETVSDHGEQLNQIYNAIENLLGEKEKQKDWSNRKRIGYK
jgi:phage regulator Rha-like protein